MRVIGCDPGTLNFGVAILSCTQDEKPMVELFGAIIVPASIGRSERLGIILDEIQAIVEREPSDTRFAIEGGFVGKGAQASLAIAEARGVAVAAAARRGLAVEVLSPGASKRAATGDGAAHKESVNIAVRQHCIFRGGEPTEVKLDASDAAAVALACLAGAGVWSLPPLMRINRRRKSTRPASLANYLSLVKAGNQK